VFGIGDFVRVISMDAVVDNPLTDGQFLALVFVPVVGVAVIGIVTVEAVLTGYHVVCSDDSIRAQASGRLGYILIRTIEAGVAVVGLLFVVLTASTLFSYSMPPPVSVGLLVGLTAVSGAALIASLVRSVTELWYF